MEKKPRKKIVYISPNGYLGGAERFVLEACTGHKEYGEYDPVVLFFNDGDAIQLFRERNIAHFILNRKFKLSKPLELLKACFEIRKLFLDNQWEIYNATMAYPQFVMGLALWNLPVKRIWYQHGPVGNIFDYLASLFPYDFSVFNSSYTLSCHRRIPLFYGANRGERIIPYGIPEVQPDLSECQNIRNQYLKNEGSILLLLAGRICSWKGYETALKALQIIFKNSPGLREKVQLILVGDAKTERDQPYKSMLQNLAEDPLLKGNVHFLGRKTNIQDYLKAADAFLHTSTIPEPFGLVVAEAMQQGTLVLGTNQGGTPDMLHHGVTGYSFDSTNNEAVEQLTELLQKVITLSERDPKALESLSLAGKQKILKDFNVPEMTKNLESLYTQS